MKIECVGVGANIEVVPLDVVVVVVVVVLREKVGLFLARDVKSKDGRFWKSFCRDEIIDRSKINCITKKDFDGS